MTTVMLTMTFILKLGNLVFVAGVTMKIDPNEKWPARSFFNVEKWPPADMTGVIFKQFGVTFQRWKVTFFAWVIIWWPPTSWKLALLLKFGPHVEIWSPDNYQTNGIEPNYILKFKYWVLYAGIRECKTCNFNRVWWGQFSTF